VKFPLVLALIAGFVSGLQATVDKPPLAKSEYMITDWCGFLIERGETGIDYALSMKLIKARAAPLYLRTLFENPMGGRPLVVESEVKPGEKTFRVRSDGVPDLQDDHIYRVKILIFDSPRRTHQIGEHVQYVRFINLFGPNQTMQPTASPRTVSLSMTNTRSFQTSLAAISGG
jgi:hypothetical protein